MKKQKSNPKEVGKDESSKTKNPMHNAHIEKVVVSCGATDDDLVKSKKLLELIASSKAQIIQSRKRIPDFGVRPGLEVGTRITLRKIKAIDLLKRLLGAIDNKLKKKQISDNHFSFGIKEYIEIPGMEYQRDIGIRGLNATVVFARPGIRVRIKKIKSGRLPTKHHVTKQEIITYMEEVFKTRFT